MRSIRIKREALSVQIHETALPARGVETVLTVCHLVQARCLWKVFSVRLCLRPASQASLRVLAPSYFCNVLGLRKSDGVALVHERHPN